MAEKASAAVGQPQQKITFYDMAFAIDFVSTHTIDQFNKWLIRYQTEKQNHLKDFAFNIVEYHKAVMSTLMAVHWFDLLDSYSECLFFCTLLC